MSQPQSPDTQSHAPNSTTEVWKFFTYWITTTFVIIFRIVPVLIALLIVAAILTIPIRFAANHWIVNEYRLFPVFLGGLMFWGGVLIHWLFKKSDRPSG